MTRAIEAPLDINPCSDPNAFNPNGKGMVPVGIHHTADFDPNDLDSDVDVSSLRFEAPGVMEVGDGTSPEHDGHIEAVVPREGDGMDDLVVHLAVEDTGFDGDENMGRLEGGTLDGTPLLAEDGVSCAGGGGGGGNGTNANGNGDGNGG